MKRAKKVLDFIDDEAEEVSGKFKLFFFFFNFLIIQFIVTFSNNLQIFELFSNFRIMFKSFYLIFNLTDFLNYLYVFYFQNIPIKKTNR